MSIENEKNENVTEINVEEIIANLKNDIIVLENVDYVEDENFLKIIVKNDISKTDLLEFLDKLYTVETELCKKEKNNILLNLRDLDYTSLAEAIRFSLNRQDLCDSTMLLNILNLIKIYNSLDDEFFEDENIYVSSVDELLDLKMELTDDLKAFTKQLSIYFISLFKSYNKTIFTPLDYHIDLPVIYRNLFLSTDLMTLSGIFATSEDFNIKECVYINNAIEYLCNLQEKNVMTISLMNDFLKGLKNDNSCE